MEKKNSILTKKILQGVPPGGGVAVAQLTVYSALTVSPLTKKISQGLPQGGGLAVAQLTVKLSPFQATTLLPLLSMSASLSILVAKTFCHDLIHSSLLVSLAIRAA